MSGAGDKNYYTFVLRDTTSGGYIQDVEIKLPRVSHIVGSVLAKQMLVPWASRQTLDAVIGVVGLVESGDIPVDEFIDMFTDTDMVAEFMKTNKLRPEDVRNEAADRGKKVHKTLENLGKIALGDGPEAAENYAFNVQNTEKATGWDLGIIDWWLYRKPTVVAPERTLYSLRHGYAGTVDLVYTCKSGKTILTDLKSRRHGGSVYDSDHIQTGGYWEAYNEMDWEPKIDKATVLLVTEDGKWKEETAKFDPRSVFLKTKALYDDMKRR